MSMPRNLVNLKTVSKGYASRTVLRELTLGVAAGERIGLVGRNGDGKSTLLRLIAGAEQPDSGAITRAGDLLLGGEPQAVAPAWAWACSRSCAAAARRA
jgi:ATP-binding cassette subfamily F protein uup